jgi:hypothetical protein
MFRRRQATIIRPYISENVKELHSCNRTHDLIICMATAIAYCFTQPKHVDEYVCYKRSSVSTDYVTIIAIIQQNGDVTP